MKKLALVVHRYGVDVNGGAEYHCRMIAVHMASSYFVDVLTSKSKGIFPWDNQYDKAEQETDKIRILRFEVEDVSEFSADSIEQTGPYCPAMMQYISKHYKEYTAVIFFTLNYYTACAGLRLNLDNSIFLPTAHDDNAIWSEKYSDIFSYPKGILYNTLEEKHLIESIFQVDNIPSRIGCFGLDVHMYEKDNNFECDDVDYVLYAGRVSNSKNFKELNKYFIKYKERNPSELKLVVLGEIDEGMEIINHQDIIFKGFVSDVEKNRYIRNALVTILPSRHESLSIIVLESLACSVPVLVSGWCEVLKGQCIRSNAGLYYTNYREFEKELILLLENDALRNDMGRNGRKFVEDNYSWEKVIKNIDSLINEVCS